MLFKFLTQNFTVFKTHRFFESSIEKGILASFNKVAIGRDSPHAIDFSARMLILARKLVKRCIDLSFASIFLLISLPIICVIALAIKFTSKGPVIYKQDRIGYHKKIFKIWKFRTMKQESSEDEHQKYIQYLLKDGCRGEKNTDLLEKYVEYLDNKTTKVGRFLRTTSLDELPQLYNVIIGDMSLVGPRPHPVYEVKEYKEWYKRRLNVKPGLTGWSKLNLRCTPKNYEEAILYDLWYVDHWNISLDLRILLLTIPFVIFSKDAC